jgi:arylsulfatase A-like enzyme
MSRLLFALSLLCTAAIAADKPNVIFIIGDDVGYGDVSCNGATKVQTPNVDRIAAQGLRFTDGHCTASTCTPTRYAAMTGEYAWRKKGTGILPGDAALIVEPGRFTLPTVFQKAGYKTGAVGKWHLGLGAGKKAIQWNDEIKPGPREIGFDYSFIVPATGDRTPCVYVENQRVLNLQSEDPLEVGYDEPVGTEPTGKEHPELLKMHPSHGHDQTIINGVSRIGTMTGAKAARWVDEDMADTLAKKAVSFIEQNKANPFYLYFATHDIHVPRMPNARFVGKTGMGPRGDAILEFDFQVGEVLKALDRLGIADNTLVILSSDNGPVIDDGYKDQAVELLGDHKPAGPYRGGKGTIFEGGTRVPFFLRWPARIKPGVSDALVSQIDFIASFASLLNVPVPAGQAPDSTNILPALLGESKTGRTEFVEQSGPQALRQGQWKYVPPGQGVRRNPNTGAENGSDARGMLFDLSKDIAEQNNLVSELPDRAAAMLERLKELGALAPQGGGKGKGKAKGAQ